MKFKDHFSGHASDYAQFRPHYPAELFEYLAALVREKELAWDCATGNGQAAVGLAQFFSRVIATDASEKQLASAEQNARVVYRVATAEASGLGAHSVDLVSVAQALHWFDRSAFFAEVNRVLKPDGVIAAWSYNLLNVSSEIDRLIEKFYGETVGPYWDFERKLVETGYRTIEFPFEELWPPHFEMRATWTLAQLCGYLRTWSATKAFVAKRGFDPVGDLEKELSMCWGDSDRVVSWPLSLRIGTISRKPGAATSR